MARLRARRLALLCRGPPIVVRRQAAWNRGGRGVRGGSGRSRATVAAGEDALWRQWRRRHRRRHGGCAICVLLHGMRWLLLLRDGIVHCDPLEGGLIEADGAASSIRRLWRRPDGQRALRSCLIRRILCCKCLRCLLRKLSPLVGLQPYIWLHDGVHGCRPFQLDAPQVPFPLAQGTYARDRRSASLVAGRGLHGYQGATNRDARLLAALHASRSRVSSLVYFLLPIYHMVTVSRGPTHTERPTPAKASARHRR